MAVNQNFFALLGDADNEDPAAALVAKKPTATAVGTAKQKPAATTKKQDSKTPATQAAAKLPSKPLPPAEAVRAEQERGRVGRSGRGKGFADAGRGGFNRDFSGGGFNKEFSSGDGQRNYEGRGRGRRGGFAGRGGSEPEENQRRERDGVDVHLPEEGKHPGEATQAARSSEVQEEGEKEEQDKEMTLEEYEKLQQERRKGLASRRTEERKVAADKDLEKMQVLRKSEDDVFMQLRSKDKQKKKEDKEEKSKAISITEFLKPEPGKFNSRGRAGGRRGANAQEGEDSVATPSIEDPVEFPQLGKKS